MEAGGLLFYGKRDQGGQAGSGEMVPPVRRAGKQGGHLKVEDAKSI